MYFFVSDSFTSKTWNHSLSQTLYIYIYDALLTPFFYSSIRPKHGVIVLASLKLSRFTA